MRRVWSCLRDRRAVGALEFAVLAPVLLLLLIGLVDLGTVVLRYLDVERAVAAAVQVSSRTTDPAELTTVIKQVSDYGDSLTVAVSDFCTCDDVDMSSCSGTCSGTLKTFVNISATSSVPMVVSYGVFNNPLPLSSVASVRVN